MFSKNSNKIKCSCTDCLKYHDSLDKINKKIYKQILSRSKKILPLNPPNSKKCMDHYKSDSSSDSSEKSISDSESDKNKYNKKCLNDPVYHLNKALYFYNNQNLNHDPLFNMYACPRKNNAKIYYDPCPLSFYRTQTKINNNFYKCPKIKKTIFWTNNLNNNSDDSSDNNSNSGSDSSSDNSSNNSSDDNSNNHILNRINHDKTFISNPNNIKTKKINKCSC